MAHVSHKLESALAGALAGGGDPATSPLYIFGPFLKLIVVAGVAEVTFGASVWLVLFTIVTVSAMYRLVMRWITDGSGGSGLSEEEFGPWAVKLNAGITFTEYTLTFLVSMAALVTFLADRFPSLNDEVAGMQYRTLIAAALTVLTGWIVNRGPRIAAIAFGPATAAVLALLWVMVIATVIEFGVSLPSINLDAFTGEYIGFTFGGFARILAVMTGIEVFANLVAAYSGTAEQKSRKAFQSLIIIMGTTSITMLIVGPAIFKIADPTNEEVSVFTQTMDELLPSPLPWIGTLIGVAVLLSASAASAQGLQNLFLGMRYRHYVPLPFGRRNRHGVAPMPVWLEVIVVVGCFLLFGTNEETYLAIYAAGVFILLSMTGWAATKRLSRQLRSEPSGSRVALLVGVVIAALLTSAATIVIFAERFADGAWIYLVLLPVFFGIFSYFRRELGEPESAQSRLGQAAAAKSTISAVALDHWNLTGAPDAMAGAAQADTLRRLASLSDFDLVTIERTSEPGHGLDEAELEIIHEAHRPVLITPKTGTQPSGVDRVLVALDGSEESEATLSHAAAIASGLDAEVVLVTVQNEDADLWQDYVGELAQAFSAHGIVARGVVVADEPVEQLLSVAESEQVDLIALSTHGRGGLKRLLLGSVAEDVTRRSTLPVLLVPIKE